MICPKCNYEWKHKVKKPIACPRCKIRFDYVGAKRYPLKCSHCSYEWKGYKPDSKSCPRCKYLTAKPR